MGVEGVYAVTGSLCLRCLVYHNTRPSVRGSADPERMRRDPPLRNGSNVSEDRENRVVDGSRPLKRRAANTRDILSWPLSPLLRALPVVLLHDVERTIARICWKLCLPLPEDVVQGCRYDAGRRMDR